MRRLTDYGYCQSNLCIQLSYLTGRLPKIEGKPQKLRPSENCEFPFIELQNCMKTILLCNQDITIVSFPIRILVPSSSVSHSGHTERKSPLFITPERLVNIFPMERIETKSTNGENMEIKGCHELL